MKKDTKSTLFAKEEIIQTDCIIFGPEPDSAAEPNMEPSMGVISYAEYDRKMILKCSACNWSGIVKNDDDSQRPLFEEFSISCPMCGKLLVIVD